MIENAFVRDLGGIIQRRMGYRLGYDGSRGYTRWLLWYITCASTSTERESIRLSITLAAIVCVVAAQRRLAALGKKNSSRRRDESDERITSVFFSDYDRREQLLLRESERSLLVQRLALRSSQGRAALLLITQPGVDHSSPYRGVQIRVLF